jgi:hypothetical protein
MPDWLNSLVLGCTNARWQCWIEAHPGMASWVQAAGAIIAIAIAIGVPWLQRRHELRDAKLDDEVALKELRKRLTVSMRAEIQAILNSADVKSQAIESTFKKIDALKKVGKEIVERTKDPVALYFTDGVIYRAVAANIGALPPEVVSQAVQFYAYLGETQSFAATAGSQLQYFSIIRDQLPRLKMLAHWLLRVLDRFESAGFADGAVLVIPPVELVQLAELAGYDIEKAAPEARSAMQHQAASFM